MTALEEFPRDMSLVQFGTQWVLTFHARNAQGRTTSSSREFLEFLAEAAAAKWREVPPSMAGAVLDGLAQMRRDQEPAKAAPQ